MTRWSYSALARQVTSYGGVAAVSSDIVYTAATDNDNGPFVGHTTDAFRTDEILGPMGFLNTAVAFNSKTDTGLLVYGGGGLGTFDNNERFKHPGGLKGFSQDAHTFGESSFASAGDYFYERASGDIAISHDNGESWQIIETGMYTYARYSTYPSEKVWYLTGGAWPAYSGNRNSTEEYFYSSRISVEHKDNKVKKMRFRSMDELGDNTVGYNGIITKTIDGGLTWKRVYETTKFYFNQIDCISETHCMAVGEGEGNTYALATTDGGETWKTVHSATDGSTLMGCTMLSEQEAWLSGGNISLKDKKLIGYYWHTLDGGDTWELETLDYALSFGMSFADGTGYSTATTEFNAGISMYKK